MMMRSMKILIMTKLLSSWTYYIEVCEWHCRHSSTIMLVDGLGRVIRNHDGVRLLAVVGGKAT